MRTPVEIRGQHDQIDCQNKADFDTLIAEHSPNHPLSPFHRFRGRCIDPQGAQELRNILGARMHQLKATMIVRWQEFAAGRGFSLQSPFLQEQTEQVNRFINLRLEQLMPWLEGVIKAHNVTVSEGSSNTFLQAPGTSASRKPTLAAETVQSPDQSGESHSPDFAIKSGNPQLDTHVNGLLDTLRNVTPAIGTEFATLVPVIDFLSSFLWLAAQSGHFKETNGIDEKQFQLVVLDAMRSKLGPDVTEHPSQAGGIPDIRFRGVIVELKVEKGNGDRDAICTKYREQPTQYAASEARQVSIVLVLDLTTKELPPGDIRDDIRLVDVPTHGGLDATKKYPSKAFVFFVNGNLRSPSSYS